MPPNWQIFSNPLDKQCFEMHNVKNGEDSCKSMDKSGKFAQVTPRSLPGSLFVPALSITPA